MARRRNTKRGYFGKKPVPIVAGNECSIQYEKPKDKEPQDNNTQNNTLKKQHPNCFLSIETVSYHDKTNKNLDQQGYPKDE